MNQSGNFSYLRNSTLAANLSDDQVETLAAIFYCRSLEDDEILFTEGGTDENLHIITCGRLAVTRETGGGDSITLHVLKEGDIAGEMGFIGGHPHTATLRAIGRSTICTIERERFEELLEIDPWLVYRVMQNIVKVVHDILRRMNAQHVEMTNYISKQHGRY